MYTFDSNIVSDLHKDARGFRPTEYFWEEWDQCGDDNRQSMWDSLCRELEESMAQQKADEARALVEFRKTVAAQMELCNVSWTRALEYLADAEDMNIEHEQDFDYFLWNQGIGYEDRLKIRKLYEEA